MKLIIAGGRGYTFSKEDKDRLTEFFPNVTEVVSGCARGADTEGEKWASTENKDVTKFPADWKTFGKSAGYRRNAEMANYADCVVLFPGGKGTNHMYDIAIKKGLEIWDWRSL